MTLAVGDRAPLFELPSAPGETVALETHLGHGPVVLLFFPAAFSPICTTELCTVRDRWTAYEALDATVFGISVDGPAVTSRLREEESLPFPLLSDFNKRVSLAYDVLYEDFYGLEGVAKRAAFVLDADGVIQYAWVSEDAGVEPDYDALEGAVRAAAEDTTPA